MNKMSLNFIRVPIKIRSAGFVAASLVASGLFLSTSAAFGRDAKSHTVPISGAQSFVGKASGVSHPISKEATASHQQSYLVSPVQDAMISNMLLAFIYLVLPAGVALAIWRQEKRNRIQTMSLESQIEMLERIWKKSPQHPQH